MVSAVLLIVRKGKQYPVHYVSRTLYDTERNYAPLKKVALALRHVSRRLRRYLEAHPITVITDQSIKKILSQANTSGKIAQYSVELGAYNITYEPHGAIKGQILTDFINKGQIDEEPMTINNPQGLPISSNGEGTNGTTPIYVQARCKGQLPQSKQWVSQQAAAAVAAIGAVKIQATLISSDLHPYRDQPYRSRTIRD
ncbi:reverse transcriptase domain-containing protein [Tanacetum coccineum]